MSGNSFLKVWEANLTTTRDPITRLFLVDDTVVAYTASHIGFWMGAAEGTFLARNQITTGHRQIHPPVMLTDHMVIPTSLSVESYTKTGKHEKSHPLLSAIQSPATGAGNALYFGVSHSGSGRLTRYNLTEAGLRLQWEMYTTQGVVAAPVVLNDTVFAGGNDGSVWCLTSSRDRLWNLPDGAFETGGRITADLAVDDYGVYAASQDKRLFCLDRGSGKIRWVYYASAPLLAKPFVTADAVYQFVPNTGVVAIHKNEGKQARDPLWTQPNADQVLSADEAHVYVRAGSTIVALSKLTGSPIFSSTRSDLTTFATNTKTSTIYAATRGGSILAIQPILKPGTVGETVFNERPAQPIAMAR